VLFGVEPDTAAGDYGWISVASLRHGHRPLRAVTSFVEKPHPREAERLFEAGAVWNTMVMVVRVRALLD